MTATQKNSLRGEHIILTLFTNITFVEHFAGLLKNRSHLFLPLPNLAVLSLSVCRNERE